MEKVDRYVGRCTSELLKKKTWACCPTVHSTGAVLFCVKMLWSGGQHYSPAGCPLQQQQVRSMSQVWHSQCSSCGIGSNSTLCSEPSCSQCPLRHSDCTFSTNAFLLSYVRAATKIIESSGVHFQVSLNVFTGFISNVLLCVVWTRRLLIPCSDRVRTPRRAVGGAAHTGRDHGKSRHAERTLEDV